MSKPIPLQELVPSLHRASCSSMAGGTCDCRGEAAVPPRLSDEIRQYQFLVFARWDISVAQDLRSGTIPPAARSAAMIVMARFAEIVADIDPDFAALLVPEECREVLPRPGGLDCPTRMMRLPEEEQ